MFKNITKNLDFWDIGLIKLSVASFILFIVAIFPGFSVWVQSINPMYFFIALILFVIRPVYKICFKK